MVDEATIDDYMDIMKSLEDKSTEGRQWVAVCWCDENGHSLFMENFQKEMVRLAENY